MKFPHPGSWPVRARLTAHYAIAFLAAGTVLVTAVYWLMARSLDQHGDVAGTQIHDADPRLATIIQDRIETYRSDALGSLVVWSTVALAVALLIAVLLGWVLAGRALRPLHQITATANRIADRSLHERIDLTGPNDELKQLADTIDAMLDRLDRAFDAQRRFVANASHELRTPLAVNRTMLEVAAADPNASADLREVAPRLLTTNLRSERLVAGLLMLARSEQELTDRVPLDLAEATRSALDQERTEAAEHQVKLTPDLHPAPTAGSPVLIERLALNLIQNTIRHSHPDAEATIQTRLVNGNAVLRVENPGAVIPPDEVDSLFEPFHRGNGRNTSTGAGLGLAIVRSITHAHDGHVTAHPRPTGGLTVHVTLPTADIP